MKNVLRLFLWMLPLMLAFSVGSCKDEETVSQAYDPSKPVEVTSFTPTSGTMNTQLVIIGSNFGTDPELLTVTVGGKEAVVISCDNNNIYCLVPSQSYEGTIKVKVGEQEVTAVDKFEYAREMVVSTVYGSVAEDGRYDVVDGSFDDSFANNYGLSEPTYLSFDPKNPHILYLAQDNGNPMRFFDLKNRTLTTGVTTSDIGKNRMRSIAWTLDADTMIIAIDDGDGNSQDQNVTSSVFVTRAGNFKNPQILSCGKQCNGAAVHPINGEIYYNSYTKGDLYRFDYRLWGTGVDACMAHREYLCSIQDNNWEFNITMHPSGDYAYIIVVNQHYIMRMNYNHETKRFGTPYLVCGAVGSASWADGVGPTARLAKPTQGVFVKNEDYVAAGADDVYDFYFTDRDNHCIRILTPQGVVSTFAGRGSESLDGNKYGFIDGPLRSTARFDQPCGLAYDEVNNAFYVGDVANHRLRKIALEGAEDNWDGTAGDVAVDEGFSGEITE